VRGGRHSHIYCSGCTFDGNGASNGGAVATGKSAFLIDCDFHGQRPTYSRLSRVFLVLTPSRHLQEIPRPKWVAGSMSLGGEYTL
jgi:hypothetical protein